MKFSTNILNLIQKTLNALYPPKRISVTDWADKERVLPETANEPGKFRSSRTPHLIEIMNAFSDPETEEITVQASAQVGKTTIAENIIGYTIDVDPKPILFMAPTLDTARSFSRDKLEAMIEDTQSIKNKVSKRKSRDSDNSILYKRFQGGYIALVGANSPHGLRQRSIPIIITDDIDSIEIGASKEGDPVARAEKRAQTFEGQRKKVRISTPTLEGASRIHNYYKDGTMERRFVPCPHCGEHQVLMWEAVSWEYDKDVFGKKIKGTDKPATAVIACIHCGGLIDEKLRLEILQKGKWVPQHPERGKRHRSFWINELSSTLGSLKSIVTEFLKLENEPEQEQVFINTVLGLPYRLDTVEELSELELLNRVESYLDVTKPYQTPSSVLYLVASCDVQADRLQGNVWGIGMHYEMWILNRFKFIGDPKLKRGLKGSPWDTLYTLLTTKWNRTDGVELKIIAAAIDSSFLPDTVYDFCRGYELSRKWYPIKGSRQPLAEIIPTKYNVTEEKRAIYLRLGVNLGKQALFSRLKPPLPADYKGDPIPNFIHFDETICDHEYFEEVTAEEGIKKVYGNAEYIQYQKKKPGLRNEELDNLNYASIIARVINPNWEKLKSNMDARAAQIKNEKLTIKNEKPTVRLSEVEAGKNEKVQAPRVSSLPSPRIQKTNSITNW